MQKSQLDWVARVRNQVREKAVSYNHEERNKLENARDIESEIVLNVPMA